MFVHIMEPIVSFDLIDINNMKFKILGVETSVYGEIEAPPAPHVNDEVVKLVSGKFPLNDFMDLGIHTYVFQKEDESQFSGILTGFTYDCTFDGAPGSTGVPRISVRLTPLAPKNTPLTHPCDLST